MPTRQGWEQRLNAITDALHAQGISAKSYEMRARRGESANATFEIEGEHFRLKFTWEETQGVQIVYTADYDGDGLFINNRPYIFEVEARRGMPAKIASELRKLLLAHKPEAVEVT